MQDDATKTPCGDEYVFEESSKENCLSINANLNSEVPFGKQSDCSSLNASPDIKLVVRDKDNAVDNCNSTNGNVSHLGNAFEGEDTISENGVIATTVPHLLPQARCLSETNTDISKSLSCTKATVCYSNGNSPACSDDNPKTLSFQPPSAISKGFNISSSFESDSLECEFEKKIATSKDDERTGKRNRQISTDSSVSNVVEGKEISKPKKKPRKVVRTKNSTDDDEIDKILAELDSDCHTQPDITLPECVSTSSENILVTNKLKKKKRKRKQRSATSSETVCSESCTNEINGKTTELNIGNTNSIDELLSGEKVNGNSVPEVLQSGRKVHKQEAETYEAEEKKDRKKPSKKQLAAIQAALQEAKDLEEKLKQEEITKQKKAEEAEKLRLEKFALEQEKKGRKKQKEKDRKERLKAEGKFLTKSQKVARARVEATLKAWREHGIDVPNGEKKTPEESKRDHGGRTCDGKVTSYHSSSDSVSQEVLENTDGFRGSRKSNSTRQRHLTDPGDSSKSDSTQSSTEWESEVILERPVRKCVRTISESSVVSKSKHDNSPEREERVFVLRSPVVCVLGHVDTGKTTLLDTIRKTRVVDNEAGHITQQIGATMVPIEALNEKCRMVKSFSEFAFQIPGLLIIDTPGHESFRNLRSRGSSLCDIAVLVVDIMHGLEQQTRESVALLRQKKTPFVIALNKVDRLYGWQGNANDDIENVIKGQSNITASELDKHCKEVIVGFAKEELNVALYYENPDPRSWISMVPVSAVSGDGMGNLLAVVCHLCQSMMSKHLTSSDEFQATVLEVKVTPGLGTTLDVIVVNGCIKESDTIVLLGQEGPFVSQVRSLLMPQPLRESRVKNPYQEFKVVKGAQGVKISGRELDKAIAGLPLFVAKTSDEVAILKEKLQKYFRNVVNSIRLSERGVYVQASTLGSLEALLDFLKSSDIPYSGVKVGPVVKKDVMKTSVMLEHDVLYAAILAFDVKIERDAQELADNLGIKIFQADVIYHLFDAFIQYRDELLEKRENNIKKSVVFPCKLKVLPNYILSVRDPIILGVHVEAGILKLGTPLCVPSKNFTYLGTISSIKVQETPVESAKEGDDVCIKIESSSEDASKTYGKHFESSDILVSKISRQSIDICKEFYRNDLKKSDWNLILELKKVFLIV